MNFHRIIALFAILCTALTAAQTAVAQTSDQPTQLSDDVAQGLLLKKVNPNYPPLARQARIQGTVVISITISKTGDVENLQLVSGHPLLAPAAVAAVRQWKYQPYLLNGDPVEVQTKVQVNFVLAGADSGINNATTPTTDATGARVRVSENVMRSFRIQEIDAAYPPLALKAKVEGLVVLKEFINKSGDVENLEIISGDPLLAPAAIDAVKQWKYRPYLLNGEPVEVESLVRVNFKLLQKEGSATDADLDALPKEMVPESSPEQGNPPVPQRIRVSSGVASGLLLHKVNPEYPPEARAQRIQGVVILQATIDPTGHVADLQLISGHPLLAPAAMEAVRQWEYRPYVLNSKPLTVETKIQVNFTLED